MKTSFESPLGSDFARFLDHKRALGYAYTVEEEALRQLDSFLRKRMPAADILTEEIVRSFVLARPPKSRYNSLCVLRNLGRFLAAAEARTFVAPPRFMGLVGKRHKEGVHVLSLAEAALFVDATKRLRPMRWAPLRPLIIGTALRVLLFTGIRRGELLALREADVDLRAGVLMIRDTKFGKTRPVPLTEDLTLELRAYRTELTKAAPERRATDPFFPGHDGRAPCSESILYNGYREALATAGIRARRRKGRTPGPRLHDLRHTFAVFRLLAWYRQKADLRAKVPILSAYLGHVGILSSQTYLHLTRDLAGEIVERELATHGSPVTVAVDAVAR